MTQTKDQQRAAWAWAHTPARPSDDYLSLVEGTPATILQCGLGQTVAFYLAKSQGGGQHYRDLLARLASWLLVGYDHPEAQEKLCRRGEDLLQEIMTQDRDRYHALVDEALDYLIWLKRFGRARSAE